MLAYAAGGVAAVPQVNCDPKLTCNMARHFVSRAWV
jgi:hypothetical protein